MKLVLIHQPSGGLPRICPFASVWTSLALSVLTSICSFPWLRMASLFGLWPRSSLERTKADSSNSSLSWFVSDTGVLSVFAPCSSSSSTIISGCLTSGSYAYPPFLNEMNLFSTLICFWRSFSYPDIFIASSRHCATHQHQVVVIAACLGSLDFGTTLFVITSLRRSSHCPVAAATGVGHVHVFCAGCPDSCFPGVPPLLRRLLCATYHLSLSVKMHGWRVRIGKESWPNWLRHSPAVRWCERTKQTTSPTTNCSTWLFKCGEQSNSDRCHRFLQSF